VNAQCIHYDKKECEWECHHSGLHTWDNKACKKMCPNNKKTRHLPITCVPEGCIAIYDLWEKELVCTGQ
jgi:hypothetical protein